MFHFHERILKYRSTNGRADRLVARREISVAQKIRMELELRRDSRDLHQKSTLAQTQIAREILYEFAFQRSSHRVGGRERALVRGAHRSRAHVQQNPLDRVREFAVEFARARSQRQLLEWRTTGRLLVSPTHRTPRSRPQLDRLVPRSSRSRRLARLARSLAQSAARSVRSRQRTRPTQSPQESALVWKSHCGIVTLFLFFGGCLENIRIE